MVKKIIPNLITLGNLFCGIIAIYFACKSSIQIAAVFICLGILLDFFDGMAARLLKVQSEIGKELDSLADIVTSGVAPAFIVFMLLHNGLDASNNMSEELTPLAFPLTCTVLLMPLFAAYRLALFNLDKEQRHYFKGLPVPANALVWVGIALTLPSFSKTICLDIEPGEDLYFGPCHPLFYELWQPWWLYAIVAISLVLDILMVCRLPMFSLKFNLHDLSWRSNSVRYVFLAGCVGIAVVMWIFRDNFFTNRLWLTLPIAIVWYVLLSIITRRNTICQADLNK